MRADSKGERTRNALIDAAIRVVASEGLSGLSYRKMATAAGVSLALVNYHFPVKTELVASLSATVLRTYAQSIERTIDRVNAGSTMTFDSIARRLLRNAITRDRERTLVWAEIVLEAARRPESLALAREWDSELQRVWTALAVATGQDPSPVSVRSATDLLTGLLFLCLALQVNSPTLSAMLDGKIPEGPDIAATTGVGEATSPANRNARNVSLKAIETKAKIVEAVIGILKEQGAAAISFRAIAERTGLSLAAPSYHYAGIADLLLHSQNTLTERSKDRYREVMKAVDRSQLTPAQLIDLTTTIFVREATESGPDNLVFFANWLEAARRPELRPVIWLFAVSQINAWKQVLPGHDDGAFPKRSGLLAMTLFVGKLVRIISTGAATADLAHARDEFLYAFHAITVGNPESCFSRGGEVGTPIYR